MSTLQDKLYNYEQSPPAKVWDKIAAALDESHLADDFPSKIYNSEADPPAHAWNKIADALEPADTIVVSLPRKGFSFLRYAVAAVLIGLAAFGVIKWINKSDDNLAGKFAAVNSTHTDDRTDNANKSIEAPVNGEKQELNPENSNEAVTSTPTRASTTRKTKTNYSAGDNSDVVAPMYAYNETAPNIADRYIMYMTPDGGIVRMSKKWGNLVCCVSGQEQDEDCKDQIKKWQEKMACAPVATSNFADILSLVTTLNNSEL